MKILSIILLGIVAGVVALSAAFATIIISPILIYELFNKEDK